jgi:hypothetical protein
MRIEPIPKLSPHSILIVIPCTFYNRGSRTDKSICSRVVHPGIVELLWVFYHFVVDVLDLNWTMGR